MSVIGAPPQQKRGTVFGDVAQALLRYVRYNTAYAFDVIGAFGRETSATSADIRRAVLELSRAGAITIGEGWVVTPAEPEPDPAVTTYGERMPGYRGAFRFDGVDDIYIPENHTYSGGHALKAVNLRDGSRSTVNGKDTRAHIVDPTEVAAHMLGDAPASVVVHERPKAYWSGVTMGGDGTFQFTPSHCPSHRLDTCIRTLVSIRAALLPSTPEPTPDDAPECRGDLPDATEDCDGSGCPACDPSGEVEPAEARSKPAPGWAVDDTSLPCFDYSDPSGRRIGAAYSEHVAIERTWQQHDAEQARKVGGS